MVEWEFSYLDPSGNFRGSFTSEKMQNWFEKGFLNSSLEIFVHRGHIADRRTLQWLCDKNGASTPFVFSEPPHDTVLHSGFMEFPPGLTTEPKDNPKCTLEKLSDATVQSYLCALYGSRNLAVTHALNLVAANVLGEMTVSKVEAKQAKSWPLLSHPKKMLVYAMTKDGFLKQLRSLKVLTEKADLAAVDKSTTNSDLSGVVCKFCFVRMTAASDVLKHLLTVDHIAEEFEDEMKTLRTLARRINSSKMLKTFKSQVTEYWSISCQKTLLNPTRVISHHLSKNHCRKVRLKGIKATVDDIVLWKPQISAGI